MYAVERVSYLRRERTDGSFINIGSSMEQIYYTSKNKAIDRAKSLAEPIKAYNVELEYKQHRSGKVVTYTDYTIKVLEYHESEGKLQFAELHYYLDTDRGKMMITPRIKDKMFFDSLV